MIAIVTMTVPDIHIVCMINLLELWVGVLLLNHILLEGNVNVRIIGNNCQISTLRNGTPKFGKNLQNIFVMVRAGRKNAPKIFSLWSMRAEKTLQKCFRNPPCGQKKRLKNVFVTLRAGRKNA